MAKHKITSTIQIEIELDEDTINIPSINENSEYAKAIELDAADLEYHLSNIIKCENENIQVAVRHSIEKVK